MLIVQWSHTDSQFAEQPNTSVSTIPAAKEKKFQFCSIQFHILLPL